MAISFRKYVDITSGVGGGAAVRRRDLILRLFTNNHILPTASFVEFTELADVAAYFGSTSEEYKRAAFYFGWISKNITRAKKIAFARWVDVATAPELYGKTANYALASFTSITSGSFTLTLGADTNTMSGINLSGAASLSAVAGLIQAAIRAKTGAMWTAATVTYNATAKRFELVGGVTGNAVINVGASTPLSAALGWDGAIESDGKVAETITDTLNLSAGASNNFGSFSFIPALSESEVTEAATWNDAQNVLYQFLVPVVTANTAAYNTALIGLSGVNVTLSEIANEYPELVPGVILAATNYDAKNSVQNYMYQSFTLTPGVVDTTVSTTLDNLRVNYYGRTQTAGQNLDFYQRGVMMGLATDPVDMNTYANEQWLKDAAAASVMELLLSLSKVSANNKGRGQLISQLQSVVQQALSNGTISPGKTLSNTQKLYISEITADALAWVQVQNTGYWLDAVMQSYVTVDGRTEWKAVYTLVYGKDDTIRKVEGSHVLI